MTSQLQADYLVIGCGAMGLAFTDVLMTETQASVIIVDRQYRPGGHWNFAYPFVRLHQPSTFYGVNSKQLGNDLRDAVGWNKGLCELASASEICAYFDQVMNQQFLPSGRVQYFPMCEYTGHGQFRSLMTGDEYSVRSDKIVDATYMQVVVPAMRDPPYQVDEGVTCVSPNHLPELAPEHEHFFVVGAGKTGVDACLFLLRNAVAPERISWIMPRDAWLLDRANLQPGGNTISKGFAFQVEAMAKADSVEDLLIRLAECGELLRFDEKVWPTMYRCGIVTQAELDQLRRIPNIIRLGHVRRISPTRLFLDRGEVSLLNEALFIDCTADGLKRVPARPVFDGNRITLQAVRTCQQVFSAAFIAHVESTYEDDAAKNEICVPVPHPQEHVDFLRASLTNLLNAFRWARDPQLKAWLQKSRLDVYNQPPQGSIPSDEQIAIMQCLAEHSEAAVTNLRRLLAEVDGDQKA